MGAAAEFLAAADFLFEKYCKNQITLTGPRPMRTPITRDEHDKILLLFQTQNITVTELAKRFGRSPGVVSLIVNGKHKLSNPP